MSHIYVYSPSGAVRDRVALRRGLAWLKASGHEVEVDADACSRHQRFAGDDATRLAALERAAASGADVALMTRGGYGLTRLLPALPLKAMVKAAQRGMRWVGMSDFTALQLAMLARTDTVSWAGPLLCDDFGAPDGPDAIVQACFEDLLLGCSEGTGWRVPAPRRRVATENVAVPAGSTGSGAGFHLKNGTLWGGNLCVLTSLLGTPYFPKIRRGLLFLEDVGEHPYRIERMLTQLLHAGVLQRQQAIVLGAFTAFRLVPHDRGFGLGTVVDWLRSQLKVPVLTGLPFGHVATKVLLPVGARCDLLLQEREALLLWGHGV